VDFKEAQIGTEVTRTITLVNKSKIPLDVELMESKKGEFGNYFLAVNPTEAKVKAKGSLNIELKLNPQNRVPRFVAEMLIKTQGYEPRFLTSMSGAC